MGASVPEFAQGCWKAGAAWYDVDLNAHTCTYHGADNDSHTETCPAVDI